MNQVSNFLMGSFGNNDSVSAPIQLEEESNRGIVKVDFHQGQSHPSSRQ